MGLTKPPPPKVNKYADLFCFFIYSVLRNQKKHEFPLLLLSQKSLEEFLENVGRINVALYLYLNGAQKKQGVYFQLVIRAVEA